MMMLSESLSLSRLAIKTTCMNVNDVRTGLVIEQRVGDGGDMRTYLEVEMRRKARTADPTRLKRDLVTGEATISRSID